MKRKDIFIGKVKKCNNVYGYKQYGDSRYVADFRINKTEFGYVENNAYVVDEVAVLIRATDDKYVWLKTVCGLIDEVKVNLGFEVSSLSVTPTRDGELFVDSSSLIQYYEEDLDKTLSVKRLRLDTLGDVRIPGGIEY